MYAQADVGCVTVRIHCYFFFYVLAKVILHCTPAVGHQKWRMNNKINWTEPPPLSNTMLTGGE